MLPLEERIGLMLKHAGVAITITSFTDILAFIVGAQTDLPALQMFCLYSAFCLFSLFLIHCSLLVALFTLDIRRAESGRDACCLWRPAPQGLEWGMFEVAKIYAEFHSTVTSSIYEMINVSVTKRWCQVVINTFLFTSFGLCLWRITVMKSDLSDLRAFSKDSTEYNFLVGLPKYFDSGVGQLSEALYLGEEDYVRKQNELERAYDIFMDNHYIVTSRNWFTSYKKWASQGVCNATIINDPSIIVDNTTEMQFYGCVHQFISSSKDGEVYASDVYFSSTPDHRILASRFFSRLNLTDASLDEELMKQYEIRQENVKKIEDELNLPSAFINQDQEDKFTLRASLGSKLPLNLGLTMAAVFVAVFLIINDIRTAFAVIVIVTITLVQIVGVLEVSGVKMEPFLGMFIIIALGLSVDFSSHVGHAYAVSCGYRNERAFQAVKTIGPAVLYGGISTSIPFLMLMTSTSYGFKIMFKTFVCLTSIGMFNSLISLPVLLSSIGEEKRKTDW